MSTCNPRSFGLVHLILAALGVSISLSMGCYDPTSDKVDAGGGAAKQVDHVNVAENDIEFLLDGDNTDIKWTGSNAAGLSPYGFFYELTGKAIVDGDSKKLKHLEITIDMNGVKATNESLTEKLKHKGFFQVDEFPESTFVLTSVDFRSRDGDPAGTNTIIEGNFQLRDVTQSITIPVEVALKETSAQGKSAPTLILKSEFKLNRKDYGVVYSNATEDALIRDDILISIEIEATQETSN